MPQEIQNVKLTVIEGGKTSQPHGDYIHHIFKKDGYLAKGLDGYEPRDGQIEMARAIDSAIRNKQHLIAEGPTGTGKSLSYCVPAAYHAVYNDKKICIVTANKNLQRQVLDKDLRTLANIAPWDFRYAVRKGLGSYLCVRDFEDDVWQGPRRH